MPRGTYYPEEIRAEARRLRREGWSLGEISRELGPPKNTLTLWVRDIKLTPDQQAQLRERERAATARNRLLAAKVNRRARVARIDAAKQKAEAVLDTISDYTLTNHVAAAMLYLAEGAKSTNSFAFANSNPQLVRYWLYLLRTSFDIEESKFRIQLMVRMDQDIEDLKQFWTEVTGITAYIKGSVDARTAGKPTERSYYKGVCKVLYHDVSIRRYLDALAHGLMERALGDIGEEQASD